MNSDGFIECRDFAGMGYIEVEEWPRAYVHSFNIYSQAEPEPQWVEVQCRKCEGSGWLEVLEVLAG